MSIPKEKMQDALGRPLTQSLFLEIGYTDFAVYTLKEYDHTYNGVVYPSLKALYLKEEDPTEYLFATKHLLGWDHWKRLQRNKEVNKYIVQWREELELKIQAMAVREMQTLCGSENGNFSAAKFLADKGWLKRTAGRPSKGDEEKEARIAEHVANEFADDIARLGNVVPFDGRRD